ncbi:MAG: amidohydrolase [Candidatus Latescibacteria bacterium]|nr:amidohydrolase [Candidatus Latescibacterota bacterium]
MTSVRLSLTAAAIVGFGTMSACGKRGPEQPADLILANGVVRTFAPVSDSSDANESVTALAILGDRIVYVGDDEGARAWRGEKTRWVDLAGRTVLPGLVDAHGHLSNLGRSLEDVQLVGTTSRADVLRRVKDMQARVPAGEWIHGRGWDQNDWSDSDFPTWRDLAGTEANPVYLGRVDGHALWLNRTALDACGITRATQDPPGGRIVRDARGEPTGILVDEAEKLLTSHVPVATGEELDRRLARAIQECNRLGLTGVHDAGTDPDVLASLRRLGERDALTINVYCMLDSDAPAFVRAFFETGPSTEFEGRLVARAVKLRADGALGSRGAALLRPYDDDPGNVGLLVDPPDSLYAWTRDALRAGFQVCTHAIGDRGNRVTLDAYQRALAEVPSPDARLRIEHVQVVDPLDLARFAPMGVIASMQPTHATSDMPWAAIRVGNDRLTGAYAWRTLIESGAILAFGSDFPVESVDPLWGIYAAVTRMDHDGHPTGGWMPEQLVSAREAVRAFTYGAAFAAFDGQGAGTIEAGKRADLTVLDRDVLAIPPREILETRATMTIVRGRVVYEGSP